MRHAAALLLALFTAPRLVAQAVERTDTPKKGAVRVTLDPRVEYWSAQFGPNGRQRLGGFLDGDSVGAAAVPALGP
ncbi:MAG TPA: hypothetical protein VI160_08235, partial [Gemmatimonadales bacterium]